MLILDHYKNYNILYTCTNAFFVINFFYQFVSFYNNYILHNNNINVLGNFF